MGTHSQTHSAAAMTGGGAWLAGGLPFPVLMSTGSVSRVPCLVVEAGDTCLRQRSSLSSFSTVFLKSGVPDEVPPRLKGPTHFRGG